MVKHLVLSINLGNRELKRDYEKLEKELQKAKELNNRLKKELEASKLNLI